MFYVNEQIYQVGSIKNMYYPIYFQYDMVQFMCSLSYIKTLLSISIYAGQQIKL